MKLTKYDYRVLIIKDTCQMMEFVLWLIFIKISCKEIKKNCDKKDCNKEDHDN